KALTAVPVKIWAQAHNLPVHQPASLRKDAAALQTLRDLKPDVIVVAAYGLILPQNVLDIPPYGCLNVHASVLPRHRGAAPITSAILAGDAETGITIMKMDAGLDTGPLLAVTREPIRSDDTTYSLSERLATIGARLLSDTLPKYFRGVINPQPQPSDGATYSLKIQKKDALINWSKPAIEIERMVRAYTPWPGAYTFWNGTMLKILTAEVRNEDHGATSLGLVIRLSDGAIGVTTGVGLLVLHEIQLAGRKAMKVQDFVRGQASLINTQLTMSHTQ
ncbi:MAG TPA: methionyl-tRNA formyltransferase, partial [Anaerolineae bacterium]|nr:methionyl-tRNA formyltransferase [Anaerolineae bacterium]